MTDKIVKEYDVYVDSFLTSDLAQKLYVLQYPLRPPWRPYDTDNSSQVKVKPNSRKLQFNIPQDGRKGNFKSNQINTEQTKQQLTSTLVEQGAQFALGCLNVKQDKLVLIPVNEMLQMKPNMEQVGAYVEQNTETVRDITKQKQDEEDQAKQQNEKLSGEKKDDEPVLVEMKVKGRENERQEQYRINSYSYQKQLESSEAWVELQFHSPDSHQTQTNMNKILGSVSHPNQNQEAQSPRSASVQQQHQFTSMQAKEYLFFMSPQLNQNLSGIGLGSKINISTGPQTKITKIEGGQLQLLKESMAILFRHHSVCNLKNIKEWIEEQPPPTRDLTNSTDDALHKALIFDHSHRYIKGSYVLGEVGTQEIDKIRTPLLDLFEQKEGLKKGEIDETFKAIGIQIPNHIYTKIMKDLCYSKGALWYIKPGF